MEDLDLTILYEAYDSNMQRISLDFVRYLYNEINWDVRIIGIKGARGTGKTTMLLQRIKAKFGEDGNQALYASLDNIWFNTNSLMDLVRYKFALSNLVACCHCGGFYQRTHWNIHGRKSIVWRCLSRLKQKYSEVECHSRTVKESELQSVAVKAINEVFSKQDSYLSQLKANIEKALSSTNADAVAEVDSRIATLQKDLLKRIKQRKRISN